MIYVSGRYLNLLERALSVTATPSADANFPVTNLYDGRPSAPFRFGSNAAAPKVEIDLASFSPITSGSATFTARSSERRRLTQTAGTTTVQNLTTGKYLTSGGAWQVGTTNALTGSGSLNWQVESRALCGDSDSVSITVATTAGTAVVDFPRWNAMILAGHSLDPLLTIKAQSDDNSGFSSATDIGTFTVARPTMYVYSAGGVAERYVRLSTTGTNTAAAWIGELVVCWMEVAARGQAPEWSVKLDFPQVRAETRAGDLYAYPLSAYPQRVLQLSFIQRATAQYAEMRDEIVERSQGGRYATVINPYEAETDVVIHGRLDSSWASKRVLVSLWQDDLIISEDPFPVVLA